MGYNQPMDPKDSTAIKRALELQKARHLAEAEAEIARDMADLERLLIKYQLQVVPAKADAGVDALVTMPDGQRMAVQIKNPEPADFFRDRLTIRESDTQTGAMTIATLVRLYRTDPRSPYRNLKPKVRANYDSVINRMHDEIGSMTLDQINAEFLKGYHKKWVADGRIALGHSMVTKLRLLASFGVTTLNDEACTRLSVIMNRLEFPVPTAREKVGLTLDQVNAVREKAHWIQRPSIALAQALQYEFSLPQRVVIGEWVSMLESGDSDIVSNELKWLTGLRWDDVGDDMVLRGTIDGEKTGLDFKHTKMVLEELQRIYGGVLPKRGAMIINEHNGLPYTGVEYRRQWRRIADYAGVPKDIRNSDVSNGVVVKTENVKISALMQPNDEGRIH
ncbi:hypothetical protein [Bradyrhizobium sp. Arg816]|uniref:hypothetical protein n=1 Tax=Bradyrhizobium sp. Arg816 TaxID=2998491 RepID=UPI00249E31D6|nr:hypothetical protein [Bradyrhizobium sp. Arg816]MDI3566629.1 hypothetical protein [Bradyrhizobium sp. Arg816]